jgi:Uma2 family endonuclease
MAIQMPRRQFTTDDYEQMITSGILKEDDRVELIHGEIVEMAPISLRHSVCVTRLEMLFHEQLGRTAIVWGQNPIRLPDNSQPQPDVVLPKWRDDLYAAKHPEPDDVLLLVEVSDSSLVYDRKVKLPIYAEAQIGQVWLVNLPKNVIEIYKNPKGGAYQEVERAGKGAEITLLFDREITFKVDQIVG